MTSQIRLAKMLEGVSAVSTGDAHGPQQGKMKSYQAVVYGTGAVTATVIIQVSNNNVDWEDMITFTLSGVTRDSDGASTEAPWLYVRGKVTAITGTNAKVDVLVGEH
jgi:hypothetical protein